MSKIDLKSRVQKPTYNPQDHGIGIVHLGLSAFHKAHQAVYTDQALADAGGDWRILGVSLRSVDIPKQVNDQKGLYTVLQNSEEGYTARVIGSLAGGLAASESCEEILRVMSVEQTRIVSLTVTEKGYGIDRLSGKADRSNPVVKADLLSLQAPKSVLGFLVEALRRRKEQSIPPFTILSCDNLPDNGAFLKKGLLDFAQQVDPELANWIEQTVAFPSTMVDRITPAQTAETIRIASELSGFTDKVAIEAEPFHQWVIEDHFPTGRPKWEHAGAIFTQDVAPYEKMKLRMLNGAHSMLAYAGFLLGHVHVRDVMKDPALVAIIDRHMSAAALTLSGVEGAGLEGIDLKVYQEALLERFANPSIAHQTYQIAMDGSQKFPQRIFQPAVSALGQGQSLKPFAFATALWMRYCLGRTEQGEVYALRDPMEDQIKTALTKDLSFEDLKNTELDAEQLVDLFFAFPGLFPEELKGHKGWKEMLQNDLNDLCKKGVRPTVEAQAKQIKTV